ncbi:MAG: hypothetical protein VX911_00010 [Candidatus Latescibacterota bacterium]|nr:hypothetical protein [Candidatus Latescibacterota bacterium]
MIELRLRQPLRTFLGDEPDGVQSMYLYKGLEQRRHQDACTSPAACRPGPESRCRNGTIHIRLGLHKGPLLEKGNFREDQAGNRGPCSTGSGRLLRALFEQNVEASKGDLVFFDGD